MLGLIILPVHQYAMKWGWNLIRMYLCWSISHNKLFTINICVAVYLLHDEFVRSMHFHICFSSFCVTVSEKNILSNCLYCESLSVTITGTVTIMFSTFRFISHNTLNEKGLLLALRDIRIDKCPSSVVRPSVRHPSSTISSNDISSLTTRPISTKLHKNVGWSFLKIAKRIEIHEELEKLFKNHKKSTSSQISK